MEIATTTRRAFLTRTAGGHSWVPMTTARNGRAKCGAEHERRTLADGGHFAPDFYDRLHDFWEALHTFTVLHQNDAKGEITLKIPVQMARHGEITIGIKAEIKLPELPKQ